MHTTTLEMLASDDRRVPAIWRALEAANTSYFLAWGWIENWLAALPAELRPRLAVLAVDGAPIAAGFLARHWWLRHHVLPSRSLILNATGVARLDELGIAHNGLVGATDALPALVEQLPRGWEELCLPAIDPMTLPTSGVRVIVDREVAAPYVDLSRVRAAREGFLGMLAPELQARIRATRRELGPLAIEIADDPLRARAMFDELVALRRDTSLADPWIVAFHRALIAKRFAAGELELARFSTGSTLLGCLYSFTYRGRVTVHQSAFTHHDAGLVCQAVAIAHAATAGRDVYDLPVTDRCLATGETTLAWLRLQRPLVRWAHARWTPAPLL